MKRKWFAPTLLVIFLLFALSACGGNQANQPAAENNSPAAENTQNDAPVDDAQEDLPAATGPFEDLVFSGFAAEKIDPAIAGDEDQALLTVSNHIYDQLVELVDGESLPSLAAEWSLSDDELTYEFRLRPDAVFSDGTQITSDVILANFNRWFDPENPLHGGDSSLYVAWQANFDGFRGEVDANDNPVSKFDGVEKVDNLVFLIHLNVPMENFLEVISGVEFSILNPDTLAAEGDQYGTKDGSVVGSGPYQVGAWDDSGLTLVESDTYWGASE